MSNQAAKHALTSSKGQLAQFKKYTVQPTGLWKRLNDFFAIDSRRSTGIPLNPQYRNPYPGAADAKLYDDPVTIPAADLAENPYWKRDVRRSYPRPSVISQGDIVGLLTVGSKAAPKQELIGEAGTKQLVAVKEEGEKGLAVFFERKGKEGVSAVLGPNGMPPLPSGASTGKQGTRRTYELLKEQSYGDSYPCRVFE